MSWILIATIVMSVSALVLAIAGAVAVHRRADNLLVRLDELNRDIEKTVEEIEAIAAAFDELEKEK